MENEMYQDELEQFLQDELKDHRMYPSDHIWRNIHSEVNGHQSWPALSFISILIISALTVSTLLSNHPSQKLQNLSNFKLTDADKPLKAPVYPHNIDIKAINPTELTATTIADMKTIGQLDKPNIEPAFSETPIITMQIPTKESSILVLHNQDILNQPSIPSLNQEPAIIIPITKSSASVIVDEKPSLLIDGTEKNAEQDITELVINNTLQESFENETTKPVTNQTDAFLKDFDYSQPIHIEKRKNAKFGFGFYVTTSTSYRTLMDEKAKEILGAAPVAAPAAINYTTDINQIVRHKPAVGLEIGFSLLYNMTPRLKFKTGIQYNTRQYYIETFQTAYDVTTISLVNNRGVENISVFTPYNNTNGYRATQLDNKMYQVSIPIGFQYDIIKGNRIGVTAEASIQPTFTLNKTLYLLASDYKHYADGNNLMRKWNINSSYGVNITYKAGAYQWYLGPQARFQHLPTYSNQYPITEYLMDYGIRLGFVKQLK